MNRSFALLGLLVCLISAAFVTWRIATGANARSNIPNESRRPSPEITHEGDRSSASSFRAPVQISPGPGTDQPVSLSQPNTADHRVRPVLVTKAESNGNPSRSQSPNQPHFSNGNRVPPKNLPAPGPQLGKLPEITSGSVAPSRSAAVPADQNSVPTLELELEAGVPLPVAALATDAPLTPAQATSTEHIADQFQKELARAMDDPSADDEAVSQAYARALDNADKNYWVLYGDENYMRQQMKAHMESLGLLNP